MKRSLCLNVLNELKKFKLKILIILEDKDIETINSIKDYDCKILKQSKKGYGNALIEGINKQKQNIFVYLMQMVHLILRNLKICIIWRKMKILI